MRVSDNSFIKTQACFFGPKFKSKLRMIQDWSLYFAEDQLARCFKKMSKGCYITIRFTGCSFLCWLASPFCLKLSF